VKPDFEGILHLQGRIMTLKKAFPILAVLLAISAGIVSRAAVAQGASTGRRPRIAVLDFDYATVMSNSAAIFGSDVDIGKGVTDLLVTGLVKDGVRQRDQEAEHRRRRRQLGPFWRRRSRSLQYQGQRGPHRPHRQR
jgi:curli biogenesis system outer membrane secretion channel CsgG